MGWPPVSAKSRVGQANPMLLVEWNGLGGDNDGVDHDDDDDDEKLGPESRVSNYGIWLGCTQE